MLLCSSEEDNDPLTDDAASALSIAAPSRNHSANTSQPRASSVAASQSNAVPSATKSRLKHYLASSAVLSDDGVDSPTYDGDIESSTTAGPDRENSKAASAAAVSHIRSSSTSTLTSPVSAFHALPDDASGSPFHAGPTIVTAFAPSTASSSDAEPVTVTVTRRHAINTAPSEPEPVAAAQEAFDPAALAADDIQSFVRQAIDGELHRKYKINEPPVGRPVRVYADGMSLLLTFTPRS